jgi:hypothetical protein|eukprot:COSAG01_NODE_570_length_15328_cov_82.520783_24_plen_140_part_00
MQAAGCDCDFPYHSCVFLARDVIDTPLPVAIIQAIRHADGGRGFEQDGRIGLSAQRVEEIRAQMSFRCVCHAPPPPENVFGGGDDQRRRKGQFVLWVTGPANCVLPAACAPAATRALCSSWGLRSAALHTRRTRTTGCW